MFVCLECHDDENESKTSLSVGMCTGHFLADVSCEVTGRNLVASFIVSMWTYTEWYPYDEHSQQWWSEFWFYYQFFFDYFDYQMQMEAHRQRKWKRLAEQRRREAQGRQALEHARSRIRRRIDEGNASAGSWNQWCDVDGSQVRFFKDLQKQKQQIRKSNKQPKWG